MGRFSAVRAHCSCAFAFRSQKTRRRAHRLFESCAFAGGDRGYRLGTAIPCVRYRLTWLIGTRFRRVRKAPLCDRLIDPGPCANAAAVLLRLSAICRDYEKSSHRPWSPAVSPGRSSQWPQRTPRRPCTPEFPTSYFPPQLFGCARRLGENRTFVIRAISRTAPRNSAVTQEHLRFNGVVATELEPVVGNRCRTASWSLRVVEARSPTARAQAPGPRPNTTGDLRKRRSERFDDELRAAAPPNREDRFTPTERVGGGRCGVEVRSRAFSYRRVRARG
ncbi:hypothetical protein FHU38_002975 [Saccharomonospora amisosensis]|uniref:Uncharacterized protein n=1 Tax=Saccharomonospora amisosensis TaxID=1128677 RepID=A0A7X5UR45_9PSEU|nr:hypothetical protein [Saccharomonospora amisosensis]